MAASAHRADTWAHHHRHQRLWQGVLLALCALFSQMAIALLPMSMPANALPSVICGPSAATANRPAGTGKSPPLAAFCPVCQAIHLTGSLLPPCPRTAPRRTPPPRRGVRPRIPARRPASTTGRPQNARAPPLRHPA